MFPEEAAAESFRRKAELWLLALVFESGKLKSSTGGSLQVQTSALAYHQTASRLAYAQR